MNRQRVINIIREPLQMQHEKDLPLIKELIEEFPYFSTPYVLLTRLLSEQKSIYLDKYLKLSASYIGDREVLYNLIHAQNKQEATIDPEVENIIDDLNQETSELEAVIAAEKENVVAENQPETEEIIQPEHENQEAEKQELPVETEAAIEYQYKAEKEQEVNHVENETTVVTQEQTADNAANAEIPYIEAEKNASENNRPEVAEIAEVNDQEIEEEVLETEKPEVKAEAVKTTMQAEVEIVSTKEEVTEVNAINQDKAEENIAAEPEAVEEKAVAEEIIKPEPQKPALELPTLAAYDYFAFQERKNKKTAKPETQTILEPIKANAVAQSAPENTNQTIAAIKPNGKISFGNWLATIAQNTPEVLPVQEIHPIHETAEHVDVKPVVQERKPKRAEVEDIISKFIQTEPRIKPKPAKFFTPQDVAERSAEADTTLVTETLANIYLKQGLNDKAIEIFQQLMLKYPQKSNYFAVKIQEINTKAV